MQGRQHLQQSGGSQARQRAVPWKSGLGGGPGWWLLRSP